MSKHPWQQYASAPVFLKALTWLTIVSFGFVLFHSYMLFTDYEPQRWVQEIYFNLLSGLPFFLFLTGSLIHEKKLRLFTLGFFSVFFAGYVLNILNAWEMVNISGLQWIMGITLLGLLVCYLVHFFRKKKGVLDFIKLLWFICISYSFLAQRFVPGGGHAGKFLLAAICLFPLLMIWGLFAFFRKHRTG